MADNVTDPSLNNSEHDESGSITAKRVKVYVWDSANSRPIKAVGDSSGNTATAPAVATAAPPTRVEGVTVPESQDLSGNTRVSDATMQLLTDQLAHLVDTLQAGLPSYDPAGWRLRAILDTATNINSVAAFGSTSSPGAFQANNVVPDMSNISWGVLRNKITTS